MRNRVLSVSIILSLALYLTACGGLPAERSNQTTDDRIPVVVSLLTNAEQQEGVGQLNQAAASLERALRIEPRDPLIWYLLAKIRFQQQRSKQAIQIAMRSISLVAKGHPLRSKNWILIADAYAALGDDVSAEAAREKASKESGR